MDNEKKIRVVKRYANRKLYDTEESRYVTLEEIASLVKTGQDVNIIDNRTGHDLTEVTLAQILFEEQKKKTNRMPLGLLKDLIATSSETIADFFQRRVSQPVHELKQETGRKVEGIMKKSESTVEEKARTIRDFFSNTQNTLDEIQKKLDRSIQAVLSNMPGIRGQLAALKERIEELEAQIEEPTDPS
jgi:polyhydroxyalkanoate synthesis repressor PhaR